MAAPARRSLSPDMVSLAFECFEAVDACVRGARVTSCFFRERSCPSQQTPAGSEARESAKNR